MLPNRRNAKIGAGAENPPFDDAEFAQCYPTLAAFLTDESYSDGTKRLTGSMSIFFKAGSLVFAVNDNDRGVAAYVSHPTYLESLQWIEDGLKKDSLDWKRKQQYMGDKKPTF